MNLLKTTTVTLFVLLGSLALLACQAEESGQAAPPTASLEAEAEIAELPSEGRLSRISVAPDGSEANGPSINPALSADGRFVAFESDATHLVENDTNGVRDVFLYEVAGE